MVYLFNFKNPLFALSVKIVSEKNKQNHETYRRMLHSFRELFPTVEVLCALRVVTRKAMLVRGNRLGLHVVPVSQQWKGRGRCVCPAVRPFPVRG